MTSPAALKAAVCFDCGIPYGSGKFPDLVLPDNVWKEISPTGDEGGLLCPSCICGRLTIQGLTNVAAKFTSGPIAVETPISTQAAYNAATDLKRHILDEYNNRVGVSHFDVLKFAAIIATHFPSPVAAALKAAVE